jgi:OOP family OmpA-OmpF porin
MKKNVYRTFLLLLCTAFFAGCAGMKAKEEPMTFTPATFDAGKYNPKVDNFLFILDASYSMDRNCQRDFRTAKNVISAINQSLPAALNFNGGLRTFGHHPQQSGKATELVYGMTKYTRDGLQGGLDKVKYAGDNSPLPKAIEAAGGDLGSLPGKSAIIIVSDGLVELEMGGAPAAAAKLKAAMGDRLCIYTIAVGGNPVGEKFLQEVAQAGGCGSSVTAASLAAPGGLAAFVENAFLTPKPVVAPVMAPPPAPPAPPLDSDGDGVPDSRDKCPDTPKGQMVDENGCTLKLTLHINFDLNKANIKPEFDPELKKAADFIQEYKEIPYILIEGYTDSTGPEDYNQKLSERRAEVVKQYLVDHYGIDPNRLIARGGGESNPVASNATKEGRAQNRRTEIICCAVLPTK